MPPPPPISCALKVLDLDALAPRSLALLQRETTLMSLSKHPNVLRVRGSWVDGHKLHIALRLMNKGSAADVMRYGWPGGMEEDVIRCILRQALQGLKCGQHLMAVFFFILNYLFPVTFISMDLSTVTSKPQIFSSMTMGLFSLAIWALPPTSLRIHPSSLELLNQLCCRKPIEVTGAQTHTTPRRGSFCLTIPFPCSNDPGWANASLLWEQYVISLRLHWLFYSQLQFPALLDGTRANSRTAI